VVDIAQVLGTPPRPPAPERLTQEDSARLRGRLVADGCGLDAGAEGDKTLAELRELYEPYVNALASRLLMPLPAWSIDEGTDDNWRTSAWEDER